MKDIICKKKVASRLAIQSSACLTPFYHNPPARFLVIQSVDMGGFQLSLWKVK